MTYDEFTSLILLSLAEAALATTVDLPPFRVDEDRVDTEEGLPYQLQGFAHNQDPLWTNLYLC